MFNHYVLAVSADLHIGSAFSGFHQFMPPNVSQVTKHRAIYKYSEHYYELEFHALEFSTLNGGE
jgi:hypothetical protein